VAIRKKSLRKMTELAKRCAKLHNDAASLARKLRNLSADIQDLENRVTEGRIRIRVVRRKGVTHGTKSRL
jgi:predicted  nucleic acid-binding Zn-ribbon protein